MLTSLFKTTKEVYLFQNFNWSPILKAGVGSSTEIWLGVKLRNVSISTPLSAKEKKALS